MKNEPLVFLPHSFPTGEVLLCEPYKIKWYEYTTTQGGFIEHRPHFSAYVRIWDRGKYLFGDNVNKTTPNYKTLDEAIAACENHRANEKA